MDEDETFVWRHGDRPEDDSEAFTFGTGSMIAECIRQPDGTLWVGIVDVG